MSSWTCAVLQPSSPGLSQTASSNLGVRVQHCRCQTQQHWELMWMRQEVFLLGR
jgi:hypothetical protein